MRNPPAVCWVAAILFWLSALPFQSHAEGINSANFYSVYKSRLDRGAHKYDIEQCIEAAGFRVRHSSGFSPDFEAPTEERYYDDQVKRCSLRVARFMLQKFAITLYEFIDIDVVEIDFGSGGRHPVENSADPLFQHGGDTDQGVREIFESLNMLVALLDEREVNVPRDVQWEVRRITIRPFLGGVNVGWNVNGFVPEETRATAGTEFRFYDWASRQVYALRLHVTPNLTGNATAGATLSAVCLGGHATCSVSYHYDSGNDYRDQGHAVMFWVHIPL